MGVSHLKTLPKGKVNLIESSGDVDKLSRLSNNFSPVSIETKKKPESVIFEDNSEPQDHEKKGLLPILKEQT